MIADHSKSSNLPVFAFCDLVGSFLENKEAIGGQVHDFFTTSHVYGNTSFCVVPDNFLDNFRKLNPNYDGEIIPYDPLLQDIREAVKNTIRLKKSILLNYETINFEEAISYYKDITYTDYSKENAIPIALNTRFLSDFFSKNNLIISPHGRTGFCILEGLISTIGNIVFFNFTKEKKIKDYLIPQNHIGPLQVILDFQFNKVLQSCSHINQTALESIEPWKKDVLSVLKIHEIENTFRKTGQTILNQDFDDVIKNRMSLDKISLAPTQRMEELDPYHHFQLGFSAPIPRYLNLLTYKLLEEYQQLETHLTNHGYNLPVRERVFMSAVSDFFSYGKLGDKLIKSFEFAFENFDKIDSKIKDELKSFFWANVYFDDETDFMEQTLSLVNNEKFTDKFQNFFGTTGDFSFNILLSLSKRTSCLWNENFDLLEESLRSSFYDRIKDVKTYKQAIKLADDFKKNQHLNK